MKNFSLKLTLSFVSTIAAILVINLIANANRIFLPIVVQGENIDFVPAASTSLASNIESAESSSDNPNISPESTYPAPPSEKPPTEKPPPASPTPTATFLLGVPTYTPYPTFTPRPTSTPGPSSTNIWIGPGTPVPDGWAPPPLSP